MKPICGTCNIERRIGSHGGQNGVEVVIMAGQRKYKAYSSDKWVCPICGNIEYHIDRSTQPFWTETSSIKPPPDFEDGAVPIWETIKDAQANLEPTFDYVVNVRGGGVLAVKKSFFEAKAEIDKRLTQSTVYQDNGGYLYGKEVSKIEGKPVVHQFDFRLKQDPGLGFTFTYYITVLERGV